MVYRHVAIGKMAALWTTEEDMRIPFAQQENGRARNLRGTPIAGSIPASNTIYGLLAQLAERFNGIEEVSGSTPLRSTTFASYKEG